MTKVSRWIYLLLAWLFLAGVLVQVFLAGMVIEAKQIPWDSHRTLGHSLGGVLLLMLIAMYLGRLPRATKWLTWLLFVTYLLQSDVVIFMRTQAPVVSALHPVFALTDFALGLVLAWRAWQLSRTVPAPAGS